MTKTEKKYIQLKPRKHRNQKTVKKWKLLVRPPVTRPSITPGKVLIMLAGRYRGKRVVCLKIFESGILLISGPRNVNGVPLRRCSPRYVIATSTKIDVSKIDVSKITEARFKHSAKHKAEQTEISKITPEQKAQNSHIDESITKLLDPTMKLYLRSKFTLTNNSAPHLMKF
eukprot:GHVL01014917.1.p1 GENE.GHVL01014917.1~~GHVL01014917.1.p1  ORF type:complete len:171 (+),score=5.00 GHVL01014917.1:41-553(+)